VVKSEIATFFEAFPRGTIWSNEVDKQGYDTVLLGQTEAPRISVEEVQERLARADHEAVRRSLENVGFRGTVDLLATYAGRASELQPWLEGAEINRDGDLRLQYLAGMALNADQGPQIYATMLRYRKFPDEMFVGSGLHQTALRWALTKPAVRSAKE
jgi:spermidine synthase